LAKLLLGQRARTTEVAALKGGNGLLLCARRLHT
jgi:hypothetical protein